VVAFSWFEEARVETTGKILKKAASQQASQTGFFKAFLNKPIFSRYCFFRIGKCTN
jgi:hypothetical protein